MKSKFRVMVLMSICFLLSMCFWNESKASAEEDSLSKYIGIWFDKESVDSGIIEDAYSYGKIKLVVTSISKDKLLFSIVNDYCSLNQAIAEKKRMDRISFYFVKLINMGVVMELS